MPTPQPTFPQLLRERAASQPEQVFLREVNGPARTYAQAYHETTRWAGALHAHGVRAGARVATLMPNSADAVHAWFGINALGAVDVPVHTDYRGRMLAHVLNSAEAQVAIVGDRLLDRIEEIAGQLRQLSTVIVVGCTPPAQRSMGEIMLMSATEVTDAEPIHPSDAIGDHHGCSVLFTSGTTGLSKGVMVSYAQLHATTSGCWPLEEFTADDVYYAPVPLHHISGKLAVTTMLISGGQVVLREQFKTDRFWPDVRDTGATTVCLVGAMAAFLMAQQKRPDDADNPLSKVLLLPLPPFTDELRDRFGVRLRTIYNQTELSCPIVSDGWHTHDYRSCGRLRPGYQCRIVDEHDRDVAVGEVGELVVRAEEPWVLMSGYLGLPEKTTEAWRNLWYHTGDAFRVDSEGNYYFVDRLNDVIRRRGENISSVEVESMICEHPDVCECAAVPVRSTWSEDEVKAVIVSSPGARLTAEELLDFLVARMPRFMLPRYIEFVSELPKTPTQRVRKAQLAAQGVTDVTWDREKAHGTTRAESAIRLLREARKD